MYEEFLILALSSTSFIGQFHLTLKSSVSVLGSRFASKFLLQSGVMFHLPLINLKVTLLDLGSLSAKSTRPVLQWINRAETFTEMLHYLVYISTPTSLNPIIFFVIKGKGKAIPVTGHGGP
jgi:hypothetical protein